MIRKPLFTTFAVALLAGVTACDGTLDDPYGYIAPQLELLEAAGDGFVQHDIARGDLWYLATNGSEIATSRLSLEDRYVHHEVAPSGRLFVLTHEEPALHVVPPSGNGSVRIPLDATYDTITVSPDERFVVASFVEGNGVYREDLLFTPNRVALIDLEAGEGERVTPVTLSDTPLGFEFAPGFTLGDSVEHRFVVVRSDGAVSLVHLTTDDAAQRERIIPLAEPGTTTAPDARDLFFSEDDPSDPNDMTLFILADGSREIFAIDLLTPPAGSPHIVQPAINQITAGLRPASMVPFTLEGRDKLLVMDDRAASVTLIDVDTRAGVTIAIPRNMEQALVWEEEVDGEVLPRALFHSPNSQFTYFVELDALERHGAAAMRALELGDTVGSVERVDAAGSPKAVARYATGNGLDIISLSRRRTVSLPARVSLSSFAFDGDWLFAVSPSAARIVAVDLLTDTPIELALEAPATQVVINGDTILLRHDMDEGWVSAVNVADFQNGVFADAYGYALEGAFDWTEEGQP